jgi:uncharacterized protein (DUF1499 family)
MRKLRALTLGLAIIAIALLLLSGPGTKHGWWPWQVGLTFFRAATWLGLAAAVLAAGLLAAFAVPRYRVGNRLPVLALCLGLAAATPPIIMLSRAKAVPPIHDITTDWQAPPEFAALRPLRDQSPNGAAYGGEAIAAQQRKAYEDIQPKLVQLPPAQAVQKAIDAARALGWEVVASDAAAGRVEATDTTGWFGFKDDIVVRIRPEGAGSRIDVRSASRVGKSDIGANAARVREFLLRMS